VVHTRTRTDLHLVADTVPMGVLRRGLERPGIQVDGDHASCPELGCGDGKEPRAAPEVKNVLPLPDIQEPGKVDARGRGTCTPPESPARIGPWEARCGQTVLRQRRRA